MTTRVSDRAHHAPGGGFRNPWPGSAPHGFTDALRWMIRERAEGKRRVAPDPASFPRVAPSFARPRAAPGVLTATWVGHASFLVQVGGLNVLTDPVWGERASPVGWAGPRRITAPGVAFDELPPVDVVAISHDHYDHLDEPTVERLARRDPGALWLAPLGVAEWLRGRGVGAVVECDWWDEVRSGRGSPDGVRTFEVRRPDVARGGPPTGKVAAPAASDGSARGAAGHDAAGDMLVATCVPAQHFSGRRVGPVIGNRDRTLWCGWVLRAGGRSVYFAGDSGLHPDFDEIGRRAGPFDLVLMPVGAYDPRWFMRPVHMDPEEAVAAYQAVVAGSGAPGVASIMGGMHWGTFVLTDEPPDEPPARTRAAWAAAGLDPARLWMPRHGETVRV